ncbi:MAG: amidohydrolase family protein [Vulcanimicrobiaceae bacterium]
MTVVLHNATVWDGIRADPQPKMDLIVEGTQISAVRPSGATKPSSDANIVDVGGAFVMPGLIDMHVHLMWSGSPDPVSVVDKEGEQLTTIRAVANAQAELRGGVTTVLDLGGNWDIAITVARAINRGYVEGPRVIAAGQTIIMTGGHDPFWGIFCDSPTQVISAVRRQVTLGAGVIKVSATGGVYGRPEAEEIGQSELGYEELAAAAGEAHRFGLKAASHALGTQGIRDSVRAGIDMIEHGIFLDEPLVREMKERGTVLCPTLLIYRKIADGSDGTIPAYATAKAKTAVAAHRESFRMALEAGLTIVAGTDAGSCDTVHPSLIGELECMREYGMPSDAVLRAATSTAAKALGMGEKFGSLEPGKAADLLIVDGDPLDDVATLRRPRAVMHAGRFVKAYS